MKIMVNLIQNAFQQPTTCARNALLLGLCCLGSATLRAADWPQYRGANHDGISSETILKSWPASGLRQVWKTPTDSGFSSFTVAGNKAFTLVRRQTDGKEDEVCLALDAATGKELWAATVGQAKYDSGGDDGTKENRGGNGPRSTPSVDGDAVYVLSAYLSLFRLDASSGKVIWKTDLTSEHSGKVIPWQNAASPVLDGDLIFVAGNVPKDLATNATYQPLLAFNKKDGSLAWKSGTRKDTMTHATPVAATILGVRQVVFFTQSGLVSVATESGKELWRYAFRYNVSTAASPIVSVDIVYCSAGYDVGSGAVKISKSGDTFSVRELWRTPGNKVSNHWSTPVVKDGYLYGLFGFKEYGKCPFKCLEMATGKEMWSSPGFGPGGVVLVDGKLVVLSDDGQVVLLEPNPQAFKELARFKAIDGKCWNAPALANGKLYIRSTKEGACFEIGAN